MKLPSVLNIDRFREFASSDPDQEKTMIELFIEQANSYCLELSTAHDHNSINEWHDVAHKFKGMASFSGTEKLFYACLTAQENINASLVDRSEMLNIIYAETQKTIVEFQKILTEES